MQQCVFQVCWKEGHWILLLCSWKPAWCWKICQISLSRCPLPTSGILYTLTPDTLTSNTLTSDTLTSNTLTSDTLTSSTQTSDTITDDTLTFSTLTLMCSTLTHGTLMSGTRTPGTLMSDTHMPGILKPNTLQWSKVQYSEVQYPLLVPSVNDILTFSLQFHQNSPHVAGPYEDGARDASEWVGQE